MDGCKEFFLNQRKNAEKKNLAWPAVDYKVRCSIASFANTIFL